MEHPEGKKSRRRVWSRSRRYTLALGLCAVAFAAFAFALYGLQGFLARDDALYVYAGQLLARGIPPHVRCFDVKTPLATLLAGGAAYVAQCLRLDDILVVRAAFLVVASLGAGALFLLGHSLFSSRRIGLLAALSLVAFRGWARHAASGPRPKTLGVLWEVLSLWCTAEKRWFAAGVWGGLAFWTWQPLALLPLISALVAMWQSRGIGQRLRAVARVLLGFLAPSAILSAYLWRQGAWEAFVEQALVHPFTELVPSRQQGEALAQRLQRLLNVLWNGYGPMAGAALLGAAASVWLLARRVRRAGGLRAFLAGDPLAGWALAWVALLWMTVWDLQGYVDLYVLLPFVALALAWLLAQVGEALARRRGHGLLTPRRSALLSCALLAGAALGQYHQGLPQTLSTQREWARLIAEQDSSQREGWLLSLGRPEVLALLRETSTHPYVYFCTATHAHIDKQSPGGFEGWLEERLAEGPTTVVLGPMRPRTAEPSTRAHLERAGYVWSQVGDWSVFRYDPHALAMPLRLEASDGAYGDRVRLSWLPVPLATRYEVYRSARLEGEKELVGETSETWFDDFTGEGCRTLHYWVAACDGEACSSHSMSDAGFVGGMAPPAPRGMRHVDGSGEDGLELAWEWPAGTERFLLYRALPGQEGEQFATIGRARYTEEAFPRARDYEYWVEACNACGCSASSRRTSVSQVGP